MDLRRGDANTVLNSGINCIYSVYRCVLPPIHMSFYVGIFVYVFLRLTYARVMTSFWSAAVGTFGLICLRRRRSSSLNQGWLSTSWGVGRRAASFDRHREILKWNLDHVQMNKKRIKIEYVEKERTKLMTSGEHCRKMASGNSNWPCWMAAKRESWHSSQGSPSSQPHLESHCPSNGGRPASSE